MHKAFEALSYIIGAVGIVMAFAGCDVLEVLLVAMVGILSGLVALLLWLKIPAPWELRRQADAARTVTIDAAQLAALARDGYVVLSPDVEVVIETRTEG